MIKYNNEIPKECCGGSPRKMEKIGTEKKVVRTLYTMYA